MSQNIFDILNQTITIWIRTRRI